MSGIEIKRVRRKETNIESKRESKAIRDISKRKIELEGVMEIK